MRMIFGTFIISSKHVNHHFISICSLWLLTLSTWILLSMNAGLGGKFYPVSSNMISEQIKVSENNNLGFHFNKSL